MNKEKILRTVRNIIISSAVILGVLLAGGAAYTWYMGQYGAEAPAAVPETPVSGAPVIKHVKPADNVPESVSVQTITSPVEPGSNASILIKTLPESTCTITVVYDKTPSKDSGLSTKVADDFGTTGWSWTVEPSAPIGKWPVTVTCSYNKKSAVVVGDLQVAK